MFRGIERPLVERIDQRMTLAYVDTNDWTAARGRDDRDDPAAGGHGLQQR